MVKRPIIIAAIPQLVLHKQKDVLHVRVVVLIAFRQC